MLRILIFPKISACAYVRYTYLVYVCSGPPSWTPNEEADTTTLPGAQNAGNQGGILHCNKNKKPVRDGAIVYHHHAY